MPEMIKQEAPLCALKYGRYDMTNICHTFAMEHNPLKCMYWTNYWQLWAAATVHL